MGELAIRNSTARTIIHYMENGLSPEEAAFLAMKDIHDLSAVGGMNCIVMDSKGNTASATTNPERESVHLYFDVDMTEPEKRIGVNVTP
jgi:isoaspartyl peptidase/L-asparaginase-like protein (Ntn-hydrolase superfamily)